MINQIKQKISDFNIQNMEVKYSWGMMHLCLFLILKNKFLGVMNRHISKRGVPLAIIMTSGALSTRVFVASLITGLLVQRSQPLIMLLIPPLSFFHGHKQGYNKRDNG